MSPSDGSINLVQSEVELRERHAVGHGLVDDPSPADQGDERHLQPATGYEADLNRHAAAHPSRPLTALQKHVLFWDSDNDGIIRAWDVYTGFRQLGFGIPFSLCSLLIPFFFSYPTRLGHSWLPDPYFRIYVDSIHKAKHGSDTGIYDHDGHFNSSQFDEMFHHFDQSGTGSLSAEELMNLLGKNRVAADPAGWSFAFMEWLTTWLLLQHDGRVWKEDLRQCYEGTLFWRIPEQTNSAGHWTQGYSLEQFLERIWKGRPWKSL